MAVPWQLESSFPPRHLIISAVHVTLQSIPKHVCSDSLRPHSLLKFGLHNVVWADGGGPGEVLRRLLSEWADLVSGSTERERERDRVYVSYESFAAIQQCRTVWNYSSVYLD